MNPNPNDVPPNPPIPRLRLPPFNNVINLPPQPNDVPSVDDVRNAIRYEKEAFLARGVYHHYRKRQLINPWTASAAVNTFNDAQLVDAVVYKANVVQAKAGDGMCARMN
jgi:hypothetical protein